ncbi:MAG: endo-1,4-beta-xylanase [Chitinophagaceae bacterium]|jgi:endo-1,4-beta-xylanase|nr:endo-1,4-beta-xylanase [Chitinophagaceae bacterium]MCU0403642.1 endo-1,4-beta-xylanase [Chitinophagaceae bacterium]
MRNLFYVLLASFFFLSCSAQSKNKGSQPLAGLKDVFSNDFLIGTALSAEQIRQTNPKESEFIRNQFNALTAENIMKSEIIHPEWGRYDFSLADQILELSKKDNQKLIGHTLIWHSQLPAYVRQLKNADSVKMFFEEHIHTVASRYDGKVLGWDVVNEALNEDGTMRKTIFLDKLGPDYVTEAFRLAQKATPNAELYYNDYNNEQPKKRAGCIEIIKKIQAAGVRIDGVGIQGHWHLGKVPFKDIEESIEAYAALGLKVMITELDIEVLPRNFSGADVNQRVASNPSLNPYANGIPDSILQKQAKDYEDLFRLFLKHKDKISRVTFWGVHDGQSWLNGWPVRGRTNYPLVFDRNLQPKPSYDAIIKLKK